MDKDEERDWKELMYVRFVTTPAIRRRAWHSAVAMQGDEQPELQPADLETARSYLKKCVSRMSTAEIQASADDTFASLWAKGTVGAAKYRVRGR
jgi:hypothetical protein